MLKRLLTTTTKITVSNNPCNKCEHFRYIIKGNHITENCMLFFNFNVKSANRNNNSLSLLSEYSLEPELSKSVRNDETKCGSNGKYFVENITSEY